MAHHKVKDGGDYFVIDPASRKVTVPHTQGAIGTVGDHKSEQITFVCPQIIDGHDVSQCARRYITWLNVHNEIGHDELKISKIEQGTENKLYLTWTIRNGLTVAKGAVQFSIHFEDTYEDGTTRYRWSTTTCKDCDILDGINAVLGAYKAIYVVNDDTLVIADYSLVDGDTLSLGKGVVPEGTLNISTNGYYPVGEYEGVNVAVGSPRVIEVEVRNTNTNGSNIIFDYVGVVDGVIESRNVNINSGDAVTLYIIPDSFVGFRYNGGSWANWDREASNIVVEELGSINIKPRSNGTLVLY